MKGDILLTRDVEVIEMTSMGADSLADKGSSWDISAKRSHLSRPTDWLDGFRRAERRPIKSRDGGYQQTAQPTVPAGDHYYDLGAANAKTANTALARDLKGRHLQMIAFGGCIGMRVPVQKKNTSRAVANCRRNRSIRRLWRLPLHRRTCHAFSIILNCRYLTVLYDAVTM